MKKSPVKIREMRRADFDGAVETIAQAFGEDWREIADYDLKLSFTRYPNRPRTFVALADSQVVGVVQSIIGYIHSNTRAFALLSVRPSYRNRGIGKALLRHAEADAVATQFKGEAGNFLLVAGYSPDYYRAQGYEGTLASHTGAPYMVKQYKPAQDTAS